MRYADVSEPKKELFSLAPISRWTTVTTEKMPFSIEFPGAPQHTTQILDLPAVGKVPIGILSTQSPDGAVFSAAVLAYPSEYKIRVHETYEQELQRLLSIEFGNQLVSFLPSTVNKLDARAFVVQNMNSGLYRQGIMVMKDNALYELLVSYPNGRFPSEDFKRFLASFVFK